MEELEQRVNALEAYNRELQFYEQTHEHLQRERDEIEEKYGSLQQDIKHLAMELYETKDIIRDKD